jgi:hypothetical protein
LKQLSETILPALIAELATKRNRCAHSIPAFAAAKAIDIHTGSSGGVHYGRAGPDNTGAT